MTAEVDDEKTRAEEAIRRRGLKVTAARRKILTNLFAVGRPVSADDPRSRLGARGAKLSGATVCGECAVGREGRLVVQEGVTR